MLGFTRPGADERVNLRAVSSLPKIPSEVNAQFSLRVRQLLSRRYTDPSQIQPVIRGEGFFDDRKPCVGVMSREAQHYAEVAHSVIWQRLVVTFKPWSAP